MVHAVDNPDRLIIQVLKRAPIEGSWMVVRVVIVVGIARTPSQSGPLITPLVNVQHRISIDALQVQVTTGDDGTRAKYVSCSAC